MNEFLFTKIEEDGAACDTDGIILDVLFVWKIALSAAEPMSCYGDKPKTIGALKHNILEAIGEIQLHTIDNVLKN